MVRWRLALSVGTVAICAAGVVEACSDSSTTPPDASGVDAAIDKKVPPMVDASDAGGDATPTFLSQTGLYSNFAARTLTPGIITYVPRYPLWSDGAEKRRYLLLPPNTKIDTTSMDDWVFPVGTKVWKEFDADGGAVETRLLWKQADGTWFWVSFGWLSDGSDAVAEPDGGVDALGTTHDIPSQTDCDNCHSNIRDGVIGISAIQLGASDGDGTLLALVDAGLLTNPPDASAFDVPGSGATKDALGYLHGNCGHCHNPLSAIDKQTPMRLRLLVSDTDPMQTPAYLTSLCLVMKHAVPPNDLIYALVPGQPDQSGIPARMDRRDSFGMPPICTKMIDDAGVAVVRAWVASLDASAPCVDASAD